MTLVERDREIAALTGLLDRAEEGRGGLAVITGPVASGRTALCDRISTAAVERGHTVLTAVATRTEQAVEFGVVGQLVGQCRPTASGALDLPRYDEHVSPASSAARGQYLRERRQRTCVVLLGAAERHPVLVVVDGLHHADPESLHCLLHCVNRIRHLPMVVLFTELTGGAPHRDALRIALRSHPDCLRLRLRPLSRSGVAALLDAEWGRAPDAASERCLALTGGNPRLARALLEDARAAPAGRGSPDELVAGDAFREAVQACVHAGSPEQARAAEALAVAGESATEALVGDLSGLEPALVGAALSGLGAAGLLAGTAYRHPEIADAVLAGIPHEARQALRRRAARFLLDRSAAPLDIAPLVRESGIEEPWAVSVLRDAAHHARTGGDLDLAIDYLNHARELARSDDIGLQMDLLQTRWDSDPSAAVHHLEEVRRTAVEGSVDVGDLGVVVRYLAWLGRFGAIEAILHRFDPAGVDPRDRARLDGVLSWLACTFPVVGRGLGAELPDDPAGPAPGGRLLREVLESGPDRRRTDAARRILVTAGTARAHDREALTDAVTVLLYSGAPGAARAACERILAAADVARSPLWRARFRALLAESLLRLDDVDGAAELAGRALADIPAAAWGQAVAFPRSTLLRAATARGDLATAQRLLAEHGTDRSGPSNRIDLLLWFARGHFHLATGHPALAGEEFRACGEQLRAWGFDRPEFLPWRSALAEASLGAGDPVSARRLAEDQLRIIGPGRSPLHAQTAAVLERAARRAPADGPSSGLHLVSSVGGAATARAADVRAADVRAADVRAALAAPLDAVSAHALSDAELRVALLAARGRTNREISDELFITVSTVEQHLTRVYRKLGVRRRSELRRLLS